MSSLFDVKNQVVVVTGATGVLAGGAAEYLQEQGATVIYLGRSPEKLEATLARAAEISDAFEGFICDVQDEAKLTEIRDQVVERYGRLDALINGAGGNMPGATIMPDQDVFDLDMQDYSKVLDLNLKGTVLPTMIFAEVFKKQGAGCVLNFSSMSSPLALTRVLGYSNAKAAIDNFTRWMAAEMALKYGDKIRVNAIAPGFFISEQNRALLTNEDGSYTERGQQVIDNTPFRRFGEREEVNGTIHYLISDAASFVTGTVVAVDGGFSTFSGV